MPPTPSPRRPCLLWLLVLLLARPAGGCSRGASSSGARNAASDAFGLGTHSFRITTSSPEAQAAFDRGLTLAYGFSHGTAESEFRRAAQLDSACAMAWWGVALVNGPHINFPLVPPDKARIAWDALSRARRLAPAASERERTLIEALAER